MPTYTTGDNNYGVSSFIVDQTAGNGNYTTIASALAAASAGQTIFIRPGTYTENLTLKAGVNIVAFLADAITPNVTIVGKASFTTAGTVSMSGVRLQTNSDFFLAVTGSAASIVNLKNCYLNCSNNTGISFTSSSANAAINCYQCNGDIGVAGATLFSHSSAGSLTIFGSSFTNSAGSTTASTASAGVLTIDKSSLNNVITTSGTNAFALYNSFMGLLGSTNLTIGGSGLQTLQNSTISSGTASAISISSGCNINNCIVDSTNTNAITGAGQLVYTEIAYSNSSSTQNVTTVTRRTLDGAQYRGANTNITPATGMLGEQVRSTVASGSAITLVTTVAVNLTSISLTAGVWDVSCVAAFNGAVTGTTLQASISTVSATGGTAGDNFVFIPTMPTASSDIAITIPSYRISLAATTTVYLVVNSAYSAGTLKSYGRISATRVA
jgi:hypothetical protein